MKISRSATKDLKKVPERIVSKLKKWVDEVENFGLQKARQKPGYHDESLAGKRWGQRSIRLSRAYRAIYRICSDGSVELVEILEVNKHAY